MAGLSLGSAQTTDKMCIRDRDESNSITGQRKLLYAYIKKTEEFAGFEVKRAEAEKAIDRLQKEAENIAAGIERDTEWLEEHRKWKTMPSLTRNVVRCV